MASSTKTSWGTKRALKTKGGFQLPPTFYRSPSVEGLISAAGKSLKNPDQANRFFKEALISAAKDLSVTAMGAARKKIGEGIDTFNLIPAPSESLGGGNKTKSVATINNSIRTVQSPAFSQALGRMYTSSITTGDESSAFLRKSAREYGSTRYIFSDSIVTSLNVATNRQNLTIQAGFNQKAQVVPKSSFFYWRFNDLNNVIGTLGFPEIPGVPPLTTMQQFIEKPINKTQTIILGFLKCTTKMVIKNLNSYAPAYVKVTYYKQDDLGIDTNNILEACVNPIPADNENGRVPLGIPENMQLSNRPGYIVESALLPNLLVAAGTRGIKASENFENQFTKAIGLSKKLQPGDTWTIYHHHEFGGGINMDRLTYIFNQQDPQTPISYFPLIEVAGPTVTAVKVDNKDLQYVGTCPCNLLLEGKKTIEYCRPNPALVAADLNNEQQFNNLSILMRVFDSYINPGVSNAKSKIFNVSPPFLTDNSTIIGTGIDSTLYYIPFITDKQRVYGGRND